MRTVHRSWACLGLLSVLAVSAAGCGDGSATAGDDQGVPQVVVTTTVLGDVVATIAGDAAAVDVLMEPGADPHDVELSARQAAGLRDASLIVANGLGLESGIESALDGARDDGVAVLEVAPLVDPLPFGDTHDHEEDADHGEADHDDVDGSLDPHFWHDPLRMAVAVELIADAVIDAAPELDPGPIRQRARDLAEELGDLDEEIAATLGAVPSERRILVTNHHSLGYLADRYGFEVAGAVIPGGDTLAEPSAAALAELADELDTHDVPAVFVDDTVATSLADALAAESERPVQVVELHTGSLGAPGAAAGTYVGMLRHNAELIADALG